MSTFEASKVDEVNQLSQSWLFLCRLADAYLNLSLYSIVWEGQRDVQLLSRISDRKHVSELEPMMSPSGSGEKKTMIADVHEGEEKQPFSRVRPKSLSRTDVKSDSSLE